MNTLVTDASPAATLIARLKDAYAVCDYHLEDLRRIDYELSQCGQTPDACVMCIAGE